MKNIVRQGKNMASKVGAGLGFNTRAHRVGETTKIAKEAGAKKAKQIQAGLAAMPSKKVKGLLNTTDANIPVARDAIHNELARRSRRNMTIGAAGVGAAGVAVGATGAGVAAKRNSSRDKAARIASEAK